ALADDHVACGECAVLVQEHFGLVGVDFGVARGELDAADGPPVVLADADTAVRDDAVVAGQRLRGGPAARERQHAHGGQRCERRSHAAAPKKAYHVRSMSRRPSPSRKLDPATTMRGDSRQPAASASGGDASTRTGTCGATCRRRSASISGSAARRVDAFVRTTVPTAGMSARNMPSMSLSRMAANTSGSLSL